MSDQDFKKKAADYTFLQHSKQYTEADDDLQNELFMQDEINAEKRITGKYADLEYKKIAELKMGPPASITKTSKKKAWKKEREAELAQIRKERLEYESKMGDLSEKAINKFLTVATLNVDEKGLLHEDGFGKAISAGIQHIGVDGKLKYDAFEGAANDEKIKKIICFVNEAGLFNDNSDNPEYYPELIRKFNEFRNEFPEEFFSVSCNDITEEMAKMGGFTQLIIMENVYTVLFNYVDTNKDIEGQLDKENFHKIIAVKNLFNFAIDKMRSTDYYKNMRNDSIKEYKAEKIIKEHKEEDEQAKKEADNKIVEDNLFDEKENGNVDFNINAVDLESVFRNDEKLMPYKELILSYAHEKLGDKFKNDAETKAYLDNMKNNLADYLEAVNNYIKSEAASEIHFNNSTLKDELRKALMNSENYKSRVFTEYKSEKNAALDVVDSVRPQFEKYVKRATIIKEYLKSFGEETVKKTLEKDTLGVFTKETEEKEFSEAVLNAYAKGNENLNIMRSMVEKKISTYTGDDVIKVLQDRYAERIFSASPASIRVVTDDTIKRLAYMSNSFELGKKEAAFEDLCRKAYLPRKYMNYVGSKCKEFNSLEEGGVAKINEVINATLGKIKDNMIAFEKATKDVKLTRNSWSELLTKLEDFSLIDGTAEKVTNKINEFLEKHRESGELVVNYNDYIMRNYASDEIKDIKDGKAGELGYYEEVLKGEALEKWGLLSDFLDEGDIKLVCDAVKKLISNGRVLSTYANLTFLKDVTTLKDLDRLSGDQFDAALEFLKTNFASNIERFASCNCENADKVKEMILPELLIEKMDDLKFNVEVENYSRSFTDEEAARKKRLDLAFIREVPKQDRVEYKFLAVKGDDNYIIKQSKDFKPEERNQKFEYAKIAREAMKSCDSGLMNKFILALYNMTEKSEAFKKLDPTDSKFEVKRRDILNQQFKDVRNFAVAYLEKEAKGGKKITEADILQKKKYGEMGIDLQTVKDMHDVFDKLKDEDKCAGRDKYFEEFILLEMGPAIFSHEIDPNASNEAELAYLTYNDDKYHEVMYNKGKMIHERMDYLYNSVVDMSLHRNLSNINMTDLQLNIKKRLQKFIIGMEEVPAEADLTKDEKAKRNKAKYGFSTFQEVCDTLRRNADELVFSKEKSESRLRIEKHLDIIDRYKDGILVQIKEQLLDKDAFFNKMVTLDDEGFVKYLDDIYAMSGTALEALKEYSFGINAGVNRQFIMTYETEILGDVVLNRQELAKTKKQFDGNVLTKEQWVEKMNKFSDHFFSTKVAGRNSINTRVEGVTQGSLSKFITGINIKSDNNWSKLNTYISRDPEAIYTLFTSKDTKKAIAAVDKQIAANNKYLDEHGVDHKKEDKGKKNKAEMRASFYYEKVCTLTEEEFKEQFAGFDAEFEKRFERFSAPLTDRKHLDELSKARVEIESEKQRGIQADSAFRLQCTNLKESKYKSKSLIVGYFGKDKKSQSMEDAKKQVESAIENYNKERNTNFQYDPFIINIIAEKQASRLAYVNTNEDEKAAEKAILRTLGFFTLNYSRFKETNKEDAKKIMVDAMLHMSDDQFTEGIYVKDLGNSYLAKKAKFNELKNRAHDFHPALSYEYNEFVDLAEAAVIQYDETKFNSFINDRIVYYTNATEVYKEIDKWFTETEQGKKYAKEFPGNIERIKLGLYDYLHAKILEFGNTSKEEAGNNKAVSLENIKAEVNKVLSDGNHSRFLNDSKSSLGSVSYDELKVNEKSAVKTETRLDMQNYILTQKRSLWDFIVRRTHNPVVKQFAGLNLEQKKMFALALTFPQAEESDGESSVDALRDLYLEKQASDKAIEAIRSYIRGGDFNPEINYVVAFNRLQKEDGSFNDEMFKKAIDFALTMTARQQANIPKDFGILNAGLKSVERLKPERARELADVKVEGNGDFVDIISNFAVRDSEIANNFTTKLANLQENKASIAKLLKPVKAVQEFFRAENPVTTTREGIALNKLKKIAASEKDMRMLIVILQDRTALDSTTNKSLMSIKDISAVGHVNEKLRAKIIDTFNETNNPNLDDFLAKNVTSEDYKKAMINLFSYQVRDDKKYDGILAEDDFTSVTAGRNTYIDWTLLERAMSLLDEIKHENDKTLAVRMTREKVMETDNENAKKEYQKLNLENKDTVLDEATFTSTIWANSKEIDNKEHAALMAGFNEMSQMEKVLFFKALQHRDILDISKNNYYASFFGQGDRDYVNKKGRDDLANSFIASSLGTSTSMILDEKDISNAMRTLLSTQIDDTREFDNNTNIKALSVGGRFYEFYEKRSTAIDWKLFRRAIQFVHRTMEERETLIGDREIYRSQGDLRTNGGFVFNSALMRKNLHSTGSRIARFLAKKGTEQTLAHIPGASAIQMGIATMLSDETKNAISGYKQFGKEEAKEEEDGMFWKIKGYVDAGNGYAGTILGMNEYGKYASYVGLDYENDLHGDVIDKVSEIGTYISDGIKVVSDALDKAKNIKEDMDNKAVVEDAFKKAAFYKEEDRKKAEEAKANQSELQKERAEKALKNNKFITGEITKNLVDSTLNAKIAGEVIDFIGDTIQIGSLQGLVLTEEQQKGTLVGEIENIVGLAKDTILFIMQALKEKKMLDTYFGNDTEFGKAVIKTKNDGMASGNLTDAQKENMKDMSNRTFAENSHGFEGFTEQSTFVGMKITHSVLFAASSQNPVMENRIKAIAMLTALGLKQYVGRQDSEAHEKLFSAFMGEEYR